MPICNAIDSCVPNSMRVGEERIAEFVILSNYSLYDCGNNDCCLRD